MGHMGHRAAEDEISVPPHPPPSALTACTSPTVPTLLLPSELRCKLRVGPGGKKL